MNRNSTDNGQDIQGQEHHITINSSLLRRANIFNTPSTPSSSPSPKTRSFSFESDSASDSGSSTSPLLQPSPNTLRHKRSFSDDNDNHTTAQSKVPHRGGRQRKLSLVHIHFFRLTWCVAVILGEKASFWGMVYRCSWPENASWDKSDSALKERYRIAIVSDPQLTDWYSYKQTGLALWLTEFYTDLFMRRSFRRLHNHLQPDAVLFLGDLMDGGRDTMDPDLFARNQDRFMETVFDSKTTAWNELPIVIDKDGTEQDVMDDEPWLDIDLLRAERATMPSKQGKHFKQHEGSANTTDENINITGQFKQVTKVPADSRERHAIRAAGKSLRLYVAGNHEYGFGDTLIRKAVVRYKQEFGSVNYEVLVGNHSLVVLDTLALSSSIPSIREESQAFLSKIGREGPLAPRILFTHVPLHRPETTYCGDAREASRLIMDSHGEQYQNMVNASLSREILRKIQPDMIFSGDDHDWCEIAHSMYGTVTPEVTLPTFSFAQGIRQPGFVMLSLYNPEEVVRNRELVLPPRGQGYPPPSWIGGMKTIKDSSTFAYESCMLPNQLSIYNGYIVLLAVTLACIVVHLLRTTKQAKAWGVGKSDTPIFWWDDPFPPSSASCTPTRHGTKGADGVHPLNMEEVITDLEKTSTTTLTALSTPTGLTTAHMSPKIQHEPFAKSNSASTTSADLGNDEWVWPTLQSTSDTHLLSKTSASSWTGPSPATTSATPMPKRSGPHYGEKQLHHHQQHQHQHRPRPHTLFSFVQENIWPLQKSWFWTLVVWDL
ncbi:hypothetical protein CPB97_008900, partial [Podila verticillata]